MQYQISGKQIDIGEALQVHVKDELGGVVQKVRRAPDRRTGDFFEKRS